MRRRRVARQESTPAPAPVAKSRTGIAGFDELTGGGLPRGRATLIEGGPGCGKTVFALQTLVNGARRYNEPGIFVAFEESAERIVANAATFGWDLPALQRRKLFFLDAQVDPDILKSGPFDLSGMLAALDAKARQMKARRIVFDSIDVTLAVLNDPHLERRELYRLHAWLLQKKLTALITSKIQLDALRRFEQPAPYGFIHFMVDCAVILEHRVVEAISQRNLRVLKYRGSSFAENEIPFVIAEKGIEVASSLSAKGTAAASKARLSSGIARLDTMLAGGFYRGSGILVTGAPGSAKSTLAGAFAEAACSRGERVLFVSFDVDAGEMIRNLESVGIHLAEHVSKGLLEMVSARSLAASAEIQLMRIKRIADTHRARAVIIDPVSALSKAGNEAVAHSVAERLLDWAKSAGLTLFCTSLQVPGVADGQATPLQVSTLADTWIHLSYLERAGERNRALTIIKSRGTHHSNQVRELILSNAGVTLTDVYTAGGEVLMGTMRWEKEEAERLTKDQGDVSASHEQARLIGEEAELEARIKSLQAALEAKRIERNVLSRTSIERTARHVRHRQGLEQLRGADKVNGKRQS